MGSNDNMADNTNYTNHTVKIGTRKSRLAMAQTSLVAERIKALFPQVKIEIIPFTTKGDRTLDKPLEVIGGKGVFVGEIETALTACEIDMAVHSAKDLPVDLAEGTAVCGVLERGDYRDMLITKKGRSIAKDESFLAGTGSKRRRENLLKLYPNVRFGNIRGNVDTRLGKLANGDFDGIILCAAGIERLGLSMADYEVKKFTADEFIPAPCQAIIAVQCRIESFAAEVANAISHKPTMESFEAEREVVKLLGADCTVPVGAFCSIENGRAKLIISDGKGRYASGECAKGEHIRLAGELVKKL